MIIIKSQEYPHSLPKKLKWCYSGKAADVGMYDTMFAVGLRLPLTKLHRQLANYLGLFISQIALNCLENIHWR